MRGTQCDMLRGVPAMRASKREGGAGELVQDWGAERPCLLPSNSFCWKTGRRREITIASEE